MAPASRLVRTGFEGTGLISLERPMQLAIVLNAVRGVHHLSLLPPTVSLDDVERRERLQTRKSGRGGLEAGRGFWSLERAWVR